MSRQPDFGTAPRPRPRVSLDRTALAAGLVLLVLAGVEAGRARGEARAAVERAGEVRRDVAAAEARVRGLEARAGRTRRGLSAAEAPPSGVVAAVASALPGAVRLERLRIDYRRGGALELYVVAREASAWDALLARLETAARLREVEPGPESREGEVRSVVRARWAGGAR